MSPGNCQFSYSENEACAKANVNNVLIYIQLLFKCCWLEMIPVHVKLCKKSSSSACEHVLFNHIWVIRSLSPFTPTKYNTCKPTLSTVMLSYKTCTNHSGVSVPHYGFHRFCVGDEGRLV